MSAAEIPLAPVRIGPSSVTHFRFGTAVASSGHGFLVAWEEREMEFYPPGAIMVRAFDERGRPLRAAATFVGAGTAPSIAWNGREYLIVFGELGSRFGSVTPLPVAAMSRISEDGTPIDSSPVIVARQLNSYTLFTSVAWNGFEYLVSWTGHANGAAIITRDLQTKLIDVGAIGGPLSIASAGGAFEIAGSAPPGEIRLAPVSSSGVLGAVQVVGPGSNAWLTAVDEGYQLLWTNSAGLETSPVTGSLHPRILTTSQASSARLAAMNGAVVATWTEYPHSPIIYTSRICSERLDLPGAALCSDENGGLQHDPAIGVATDTLLLAWSDRTAGVDDVRLDVSGRSTPPVASAGGRIVSEAAANEGAPSMERRGDGSIIVVWSESDAVTRHDTIRIGGLNPAGAPIADHAIAPDASDQNTPRVSLAGNRALVVWREGTLGLTPWLATVVDTTSGSISTPVVIARNTFDSFAGFDGKEWLVVTGTDFTVIDTEGRIMNQGTIDNVPYGNVPAVAGFSGGFVVVWSELDQAVQDTRIRVSSITSDGARWQASTPILVDAGLAQWSLSAPAVAVNGNRVLVSWIAQSKSVGGWEVRQAMFDLTGARVTSNVAIPWTPYVFRSRARSAAGGFATLASTGIVLTSLDGRMRGIVDLSSNYISDFLVDSDDRFTIAYARFATRDEDLGRAYRAYIRAVVPARARAQRMR